MPPPLLPRAILVLLPLLLIPASAAEEKPSDPILHLPTLEVIGTRLGRPLREAPTVAVVIERAEIERRAPGNLSELLRELPELVSTAITENVAINSTHGTTGLDLRGLGTGNTLVLVDGRRTTVSANAAGNTLFVDINRFPPGLVERVEILKGGASAVYGADAVAGVINLVTRRRPTGGEVFVSHGNTFGTDAAETHASVVAGATRGRLGLSVRASLFERNSLASRDRYFSRTANMVPRYVAAHPYYASLPAAQLAAFDGRSLTGPHARISPVAGQVNGVNGVALPGVPAGTPITALPGTGGTAAGTLASATPSFTSPFLGGTNGTFHPAAAATFQAPELTRGDPAARSLYDFNQTFTLVPETTRLGAGLRADYELADGATLFLDLSGQHNRSQTDLLPVGVSGVVPRTNPYNPFGVDVNVAWRLTEAGPRHSLVRNENYAVLTGLRSAPTAPTAWEIAAAYAHDRFSDATANWLSRSRTLAALARSDSSALNPFGGVRFQHDPALIEALKVTYRPHGFASLLSLDARAARDLWHLPGGALRGVVYAEHRRERYGFGFDEAALAGDILTLGAVPTPSEWSRSVSSLAGEARLPLLAGRETGGPARLALEASARAEFTEGGFHSGARPAVGLVALPGRGWTLRASHSATFRAPMLTQLYSPQSEGYANSVPDPRRPVALTGDLFDGPNVSRLIRSGGNSALTAEIGRVSQAGLTWAPPRGVLQGLSLAVNYFHYDLENLITGVSPPYVLDHELGGLGHLVTRDPGTETYVNTTGAPLLVLTGPAGEKTSVAPGQSVTVPGRLRRIDSYIVNLSRRRLAGADLEFSYTRELGLLGRWTLGGQATRTTETSYAYDVHTPLVAERIGRFGLPPWRGRFTLVWQKSAWNAGATVQYTPGSGDVYREGNFAKPYRVWHLHGGYQFPAGSWLGATQVNLALDDVFEDEVPLYPDPPIGFTYGTIARPQGRFWRLSLKRSW